MGIWPDYSDGTDVNSLQLTSKGSHVVTGDDFGMVKLFNSPCVVEDAPCKEYKAHSSHVMNVRFTSGDRHVVSAGGWDRTACLWKFHRMDKSSSTGTATQRLGSTTNSQSYGGTMNATSRTKKSWEPARAWC